MAFPTVFTDVLAVLAHSFSSMLMNKLSKGDVSLSFLQLAGLFSSLRVPRWTIRVISRGLQISYDR